MDFIYIFALISLAALIISLIGYIHNTNGVIRIQEKQIAKLRTENFRLQAALRGKRYVKNIEYVDEELHNPQAKIIEIHDNRIAPENVPDFKKEW